MAWPKGVKKGKDKKMLKPDENSNPIDMLPAGKVIALLLDYDYDIFKWELNPKTMEMTLIVKEKQVDIK